MTMDTERKRRIESGREPVFNGDELRAVASEAGSVNESEAWSRGVERFTLFPAGAESPWEARISYECEAIYLSERCGSMPWRVANTGDLPRSVLVQIATMAQGEWQKMLREAEHMEGRHTERFYGVKHQDAMPRQLLESAGRLLHAAEVSCRAAVMQRLHLFCVREIRTVKALEAGCPADSVQSARQGY